MNLIIKSCLFLLLCVGSLNAHAISAVAIANETSCKKKLRVLVVDGYSTGAKLAPYLHQNDVEVVHFHSDRKAPSEFVGSFKPESYNQTFAPRSYEEALTIARSLELDAVFVGTETAVHWGSKLNADLGFSPKVADEILAARRDKYLMAERLRSLGIEAVLQMQSTEINSVLKWIADNGLFDKEPYKVVLKPPMSAGADSFYICKNIEEVRVAFNKIKKKKNIFGKANETVLVQEFLDGPEYVVNTASGDGRHKVTDMWLYVKNETTDGRRLYGHDILLEPRGAVQDQLVAYAQEVLNALEITTGWGHIEIIMTHRGPVLVEIGNRMMGANQPLIVSKALGQGQIEYGVKAQLHPEEFKRLPDLYTLEQGASVVTVNCYFDNARFNEAIVDRIKQLPGYVSHTLGYSNGNKVRKTEDLLTAIGHVELVHPDPAVLEASIKQLDEWQRDGSFFLPREANRSIWRILWPF